MIKKRNDREFMICLTPITKPKFNCLSYTKQRIIFKKKKKSFLKKREVEGWTKNEKRAF